MGRSTRDVRRTTVCLPADSLPLVGEIIDDDVVSDLIGRGIEHASGVHLREPVDEAHAVVVHAEHEGVDADAALRAPANFFQRLSNDSLVEQC